MKQRPKGQHVLLILAMLLLILGGVVSSGFFGLNWDFFGKFISLPAMPKIETLAPGSDRVRVTVEESVIIDVVDTVSPSVVTIGIHKTRRVGDVLEFDPF